MQPESDDQSAPDEIREAPAIARRALALFAVVGIGLGAPTKQTAEWLRDESLWDELSPEELDFVTASTPTERQTVNASWRSEALLMLLWALGTIEKLPGLAEQRDTGAFQTILPPFAEVSVSQFVGAARRRTDEELLEMADTVMNSHWEARDARIHSRPMPTHLDIGIVQERHHAINWVIGYDGLPWDEVTTDT